MLVATEGTRSETPATRPVPCLAWDGGAAARGEQEHCLASLLLGAGCCEDGSCVMCAAVARRMASAGFSEQAIAISLVTTWYTHVEVCPVCGFPPPPPLREFTPLPRFVRVQGRKLTSSRCPCGEPVGEGRLRFCSDGHAAFYRRDAEGGTPRAESVPRVFRVG